MPTAFWVTLGVSGAVALLYLYWRVGPLIFGHLYDADSTEKRQRKWNSHIAPLIRRMLDDPLVVAEVHGFTDADGKPRTLATWTMVPSVLPDTDFVAIARPDGERARPEVVAIAESEALRALLGDKVQEQVMWGHRTFIQLWPQEIDLEAVVKKLTPVDEFRKRHGFDAGREIGGDPGA